MEFIKKNKKQIITLLVLILVLTLTRYFGTDDSSYTASGSATDTATENEILADNTVVDDATEEIPEETDITAEASIEEEYQEEQQEQQEVDITYTFRNKRLFEEHFEKHGEEFPYATKEEYLEGANIMLTNPDKLHKLEKEDGDDVYYLEETNEFIIVSKDGYLRTYFKPSNGKKYFDKQ